MVIKKANVTDAKRRTHAFKWAAKFASKKSNETEQVVSDLHYLSSRMLKMEGRLMRLEADQSFQGQDLRHLIEENKQNCSRQQIGGSTEVTVRIERQIQNIEEKLDQTLSELNQSSDTLALSRIEFPESQQDDQSSLIERISKLEESAPLAARLDEHDSSIKSLQELWKNTLP